jgi:hypothetical protein
LRDGGLGERGSWWLRGFGCGFLVLDGLFRFSIFPPALEYEGCINIKIELGHHCASCGPFLASLSSASECAIEENAQTFLNRNTERSRTLGGKQMCPTS